MTSSIRVDTLRRALPAALALGALAVMSARAHAGDLDESTLSPPTVQIIGYERAINVPIEKTTVTARVQVDPVTLTTRSGVALLKESVLAAARSVCSDADPYDADDGTCIRNAVESAKPQVAALIARAKSGANG